MKTAIIGAVFVDVKGFAFDAYAPTGTNIGTVSITHGGVCRNVCETFARQGQPALFISMTDDTALGRDVRESLARLNVDLTHTLHAPDGMGMWLAILDEHGDLAGSVSKQPNFAPLEDYIQTRGAELLSDVGSVVLELDMNARIAEMILNLAEAQRKPVYAICANMGVILEHPEYLTKVRCFICNEIEAGRLFGQNLTDLEPYALLSIMIPAVRQAGIPSMVITMGERGCVFFDSISGDAGHCPAIPTNMVDSTGAGDAFFAGAVMALSRGIPLRQSVRIGTRLASATLMCETSCCERVESLFDLSAFPEDKDYAI